MATITRPPPKSPAYRNPFRSAAVTPSRIDQGVDYSGRPGDPIYALGPARVLEVFPFGSGSSGWPGGGWVSYRLTAGPDRGRNVFVAEDVSPSVHPGQRVDSSTVIGHFAGGGSIETGWAGPASKGDQTLAYYQGQSDFGSSDIGGWSTLDGVTFSNLMASLGAPPGKMQAGGIHGAGGKVVRGKVTQGTGGTGAQLASADPGCLLSGPSLFGIGGGCIFTRSEARAVLGAGILLAGAGVMILGTLILAAYGLRAAGPAAGRALEAAGAGIALVPGAQAAGAGVAAAGGAAARAGSVPRRRKAAQHRPAGAQPSGPSQTFPPTTRSRAELPKAKPVAKPSGPKAVPARYTQARPS